MRVFVDPNVCIGSGHCAQICPDVFRINDEENVSEVIVDSVPAEFQSKCRQAVDACPTSAISTDE